MNLHEREIRIVQVDELLRVICVVLLRLLLAHLGWRLGVRGSAEDHAEHDEEARERMVKELGATTLWHALTLSLSPSGTPSPSRPSAQEPRLRYRAPYKVLLRLVLAHLYRGISHFEVKPFPTARPRIRTFCRGKWVLLQPGVDSLRRACGGVLLRVLLTHLQANRGLF